MAQLLYVDTNILIYLLERHTHYSQRVANELDNFTADPDAKLVTSAITVTEFLAGTKSSSLATLHNVPRLELIALDAQLAEKAGDIMRKNSIQIGDAIHLATAIHLSADLLFTNDKQLIKLAEKYLESKAP
jgi:predicted nucleic acid-binding protein